MVKRCMVSMLENVVESIFNATHKMCAELMVCQNNEERIGARSICVKCMESFYFHWFGKPTAFFVLTPINKQKSLAPVCIDYFATLFFDLKMK